MDSHLSGISARSAGGGGQDVAVACDQAIFTSTRTATGQGYRIIAASSGLSAEDKAEIARQSPSHGGLADCAEPAGAFYRLPSGRLCAAWSGTAGKEPSGRGGLRIYTHAVAFDASLLAAFAYNPFNVLRSMQAAGLDQPDLGVEGQLPELKLPAAATCREEETALAIRQVGVDWLLFILDAVLTGRRMVLACRESPRCAIEAVLLALPRSLRPNVPFATGLKFSLGRAFHLTGIGADGAAAERLIRGHAFSLVRLDRAEPPPPFEPGEWHQMVAEHWNESAHRELQEFNLHDFPDASLPALEQIASLRNDANRASVAEAGEVLAMIECRVDEAEGGELERRLRADLFATARMRLEQVWSSAGEAELVACWPDLVALAKQSVASFRLVIPLVGLVLRRLAYTSPVEALERALDLGSEQAARAIHTDLRVVLQAVRGWLPHAGTRDYDRASKAMKRWQKAFPGLIGTTTSAPA